MFSFDCRSRQERSLRLLQTRSRVQQSGTGEEVGRKAATQCLVCRWSASRCLVNGSRRTDCTHCRYWNTTFKPAVDVAPRHHKRFSSQEDLVSLKRPNFRSISGTVPSSLPRAWSCGAEIASKTAFSKENAQRWRDPLALPSSQSEPRGKEFRVRFSRPNIQRERTRLAQDARSMFYPFPFNNPGPHDHRPVSRPISVIIGRSPLPSPLPQVRHCSHNTHTLCVVYLCTRWSSIHSAFCHSATCQDTVHARPTIDQTQKGCHQYLTVHRHRTECGPDTGCCSC